MDTFGFCIIITFLVLLVLVVSLYACLLWLRLNDSKRRFRELRKNTEALDLQLEAMKLLIEKYQNYFPPTVLDEIELECENASERSWNAPNLQIAKNMAYEEKLWNILRVLARNFFN